MMTDAVRTRTPRDVALAALAAGEAVEETKDLLASRQAQLRRAEVDLAKAFPEIHARLAAIVAERPARFLDGSPLHETLIELGDGPALVTFACTRGSSELRAQIRRVPTL